MLFSATSTPRVFALPVGCDFSQAFLDGLAERLKGQPPESWAEITIYVNTRRAQRRLEALLSAGPACLLPDIRVISDLAAAPGLPAAQSRFIRHLELADLVGAFLDRQPELGARSAMFGLAESLAELQDEMAGDGLEFEALERIDPAGLSGHWQRNLAFLSILNTYEAALAGPMLCGTDARLRAATDALVRQWQDQPPAGPVIVAGSTGSRATTARLMQAVTALPQGAVVLPGFDFTSPPDLWKNLEEEHPQFGFATLGEQLGFSPETMQLWHRVSPASEATNRLISLALRPAPVTPLWLKEAPELAPELPEATGHITLLEAPDPGMEATALAIRLREAVELGQRAALITPDRNLARRVAAQLARWGIQPDDSAGHPAKLTPPGIFLRLLAGALGRPLEPVSLMEILKHPLCGADNAQSRADHIRLARSFEAKALRGGPAKTELGGFARWQDKTDGAAGWLANLDRLLTPLSGATPRPLAQWATLHRHVAEALAGSALWAGENGREVVGVFETLMLGEDHKTSYSASQYRALFSTVLDRLEVQVDPMQAHPDIAIWGTLEARVQRLDLAIVAGLIEGTWPRISGQDPWLNREMRRQAGLRLPERHIGLSAHDFQQALGAPEVVISRCLRDGEAPSVASRWLLRLQNLLGGMPGGEAAYNAMKTRGDWLLALANRLEQPESEPRPASRPCPAPPLSARPRRLSVTGIETLIRDPYAVYARHVLRLYPLDPLLPEASPIMRGNVLHNILERFIQASMQALPANPEALYDECVDAVLQAEVPWPSIRALWRHHMMQARGFFLTTEAGRRTHARPFGTEIKGTRMIKGEVFDVELTAKADRIDISPAGGARIYDYKAGTRKSVKPLKAFSMQLPLEGMIAEAQGFEGLNARQAEALELIYMGDGGAVVSFGPEDDVMDNTWQRIVEFLNRFQDSNHGYAARIRHDLIDFDSDYDHLSRRGEWQDDDPASPEIWS